MSQVIMEKLDQIEAKLTENITAVQAEIPVACEAMKMELCEMVSALEAKVAGVAAPAVQRERAKTIRQDVNRMVKEQLSNFTKQTRLVEKEIKLFESDDQYAAYLREASALTGSGDGKGGRTTYDPLFVALRLANPLRDISRIVATDGSSYQFRAKTGNAGAAFGYAIQNNGDPTTENTAIWQLVLKDMNCQFPIRTAALDDIDGLEANVVSDMLLEFAQLEAQSMIQNNDQTSGGFGGTDGLRGLDQYPGSNSTYTGGTTSVAAYGSSGTGSSSGLHSLATYDQLVSNVNTVGAANISYQDVVNLVYALPQQYWTTDAKFMINPVLLSQIRGLKDSQGTPIFERMHPLETDGIVGRLLGFDVCVNRYVDNPSQATAGAAATTSLFPMYFGDFQKGHTIVDRLNMVLRRYDQTAPGFITFYGEKRLCNSVRDPFSLVRYRSTGTAAA